MQECFVECGTARIKQDIKKMKKVKREEWIWKKAQWAEKKSCH